MTRRFLLAAVLGMAAWSQMFASDFKVGDCALVLPSARSLPAPRGEFFLGRIGKVTDFLVADQPRSLEHAKRSISIVLHFPVEPPSWEGYGQGYWQKQIRRVNCPTGFAIKPYGFDPQVLVDNLKVLNKLLDILEPVR